jgi:hypothetical protein
VSQGGALGLFLFIGQIIIQRKKVNKLKPAMNVKNKKLRISVGSKEKSVYGDAYIIDTTNSTVVCSVFSLLGTPSSTANSQTRLGCQQ